VEPSKYSAKSQLLDESPPAWRRQLFNQQRYCTFKILRYTQDRGLGYPLKILCAFIIYDVFLSSPRRWGTIQIFSKMPIY